MKEEYKRYLKYYGLVDNEKNFMGFLLWKSFGLSAPKKQETKNK